jgi:cell division protein FtsQ
MAALRRPFASRRRKRRRTKRPGKPLLRGVNPVAIRRGVVGALAVVLLVGGALWLRDSALFSVDHVRITGLTGPAAPRIKAALRDTADGMSTMHVDEGKLRDAVDGFPQVRRLEISRKGRHELRVHVVEWVPVGAVTAGGRRIPVAADGTLLEGLTTGRNLATVPVEKTPRGRRLKDGRGLEGVALLATAPAPLRARISRVALGARGLAVTLRDGPDLYFGTADRLAAKWLAAAGVLADGDARGARYVDLTVPEHPAAGGVKQTAQAGEEGLTEDDPSTTSTDESGLGVTGTDGTAPDSTDTEAQVEG